MRMKERRNENKMEMKKERRKGDQRKCKKKNNTYERKNEMMT